MRLFIDHREPKEMEELALMFFDDVEWKTLSVGDYVYGEVGFERKGMDFLNPADVLSKATALKVAYPRSVLLVDRDLGRLLKELHKLKRAGKGTLHEAQLLGLIASLTIRNIQVVFVPSTIHMFDVMRRICDKHYDGKERVEVEPPPPVFSKGIGTELIRRVFRHFLSDITVDDLVKVKGIGKERAKAILRVLTEEGEYDPQLR